LPGRSLLFGEVAYEKQLHSVKTPSVSTLLFLRGLSRRSDRSACGLTGTQCPAPAAGKSD